MAKDPATLFYWNDWHGGTVIMSRHLKGCYMDLLYAQFNSGPLSLEEIKTVLGNDFAAWQGSLSKKFTKNPQGLFFNEKLQSELDKRKAYSESRRKNLASPPKVKPHMEAHMENEIENKNSNVINIYKIKVGETFYEKSPSAIVKDFPARFETMLQTTLKGIDPIKLLADFDKEYSASSFNDFNHFFNALKKTGKQILNGNTKGNSDKVPARYAAGEQNYDNKNF